MNLLNKIENTLAKYKAHKELIKNIEVKKSQESYPEQYDIFCYNIYTGFIHLRYGKVSINFSPAGAKDYTSTVLYSAKIGPSSMNEFSSEKERCKIINKAKNLISECIYFDMLLQSTTH